MPLVSAVVTELVTNCTGLTSYVSTYQFTTGSATAGVFGFAPAPEDAATPLCTVEEYGGSNWGTRSHRGTESTIDVSIWSGENRNRQALRAAAYAVWECLNRAELTATGYGVVYCQATSPTATEDEDGFPGYIVTVNVKAIEELT